MYHFASDILYEYAFVQMSFSEASKIISMMWNAMGADAKQVSRVLTKNFICWVYCSFLYSSPSPPPFPLSSPLLPLSSLLSSSSPPPLLPPLFPSQQYYDRSIQQKEEYQAFLESRKSEPPPSEETTASPQPQVQNTTCEAPAVRQTVEAEVVATREDALTSGQIRKPPTPLQPKIVVS